MLNYYSIGHFLQWYLIGRYIFENWKLFILLSIGWELVELILPFEFAIESLYNKIMDIIVNCIGYFLGIKMYNKNSTNN